jgi:hypothetical protein
MQFLVDKPKHKPTLLFEGNLDEIHACTGQGAARVSRGGRISRFRYRLSDVVGWYLCLVMDI